MVPLSQKRHLRQKQPPVLTKANLQERLDLPHLPMVDPHLHIHLHMVDIHLLPHLPIVALHLLPPSILSQFTLLPIQ